MASSVRHFESCAGQNWWVPASQVHRLTVSPLYACFFFRTGAELIAVTALRHLIANLPQLVSHRVCMLGTFAFHNSRSKHFPHCDRGGAVCTTEGDRKRADAAARGKVALLEGTPDILVPNISFPAVAVVVVVAVAVTFTAFLNGFHVDGGLMD